MAAPSAQLNFKISTDTQEKFSSLAESADAARRETRKLARQTRTTVQALARLQSELDELGININVTAQEA